MPRGPRPAQPRPLAYPAAARLSGNSEGTKPMAKAEAAISPDCPGLRPKCQRGTKSSLCLLLRGTSSLVFLLSKME